jgi:hypothetical protein
MKDSVIKQILFDGKHEIVWSLYVRKRGRLLIKLNKDSLNHYYHELGNNGWKIIETDEEEHLLSY